MKALKIVAAIICGTFAFTYFNLYFSQQENKSVFLLLMIVFFMLTTLFLILAFQKKPVAMSKHNRVSAYLPDVPVSTLNNMRKYYTASALAIDIKSMNDNLSTTQSTNNIDVFVESIKLASLKALTLLQAVQAGCDGIVNRQLLIRQCEIVLSNIQNFKRAFLVRNYEEETSSALQVPSQDVRCQLLESYLATLELFRKDFEDVMEDFEETVAKAQNAYQSNKDTHSNGAFVLGTCLQNIANPIDALQLTGSDKKIDFQVPHSYIPSKIFDLLWFSNGPFQNLYPASTERTVDFMGHVIRVKITGLSEPSAIDVGLPAAVESLPERLDYYPSYSGLTPSQRALYLSWLPDITAPIDIGYVFLFYYGLERHLLFGKSEEALNAILTLRKYHHNKSFMSYSGDAVVLYALIKNSPDTLTNLDIETISPDLRLFIEAFCTHSLSAQAIIKGHKYFLFDNTRYIKNEPALFYSTLEGFLNTQYGQPSFPITLDDFRGAEATLPLVLANYSLLPPQRQLNLPDIATSPLVRDSIHTILVNTHESVKVKLREARKALQTQK